MLDKIGLDAKVLYHARGCECCNRTGFRGRSSIVEVMPLGNELRRELLKNADAEALQRIAVEGGMQTMRAQGLKKAAAGLTTVEEVLRATRSV